MNAEIEGVAHDADPVWELTRALASAAGKDGEMLRARLRIAGVLEPSDQVLSAPGVVERVIELGAGWRDEPRLGPSRDELLRILAA